MVCIRLSCPSPEHERTLLARRIEATDRQINALVYEPYLGDSAMKMK